MQDALKIVEKLAEQARLEPAPTLDIADKVIARLARETPSPTGLVAVFTSATAAAAAMTMVLCVPPIEVLTDPWGLYLASFVSLLF
jgi:phage-related tail protein